MHYAIVSPCFFCGIRNAVRCWKYSWGFGFFSTCSVHMKIFVYFQTILAKLARCGIKKIFSERKQSMGRQQYAEGEKIRFIIYKYTCNKISVLAHIQ